MTREEKMALAGDYVLGLLDRRELELFEAARRQDAELAAYVDKLAGSLQRLDETAEPLAPRDDLWQRIVSAIGDQDRVAAPTTAREPAPADSRRFPELFRLAAAAVLAACLGFTAHAWLFGSPDPVAVAVLLDEQTTEPGAIVEAYDDNSIRMRLLKSYAAPEGQIMQVWTLPDAQTGPVSLGTLATAGTERLHGPDLPLPKGGQLYEITLESQPGSPTGKPTGPILVKGYADLSR